MKELEEFDVTLNLFNKEKIFIPDQEEMVKMIEYVYKSNKLEGNSLNLYETTKILTDNLTSDNKPLGDYLEAKGNLVALRFVVMAARNKYPFNEKLLKQVNTNIFKKG